MPMQELDIFYTSTYIGVVLAAKSQFTVTSPAFTAKSGFNFDDRID